MSIEARFGATADLRPARCTAVETVGDFVCIYGPKLGGVDQVRKADPSDYDLLPAVGVVVDKADAEHCTVQWMGETPPIFSGLSEGEIYFLGANSKIAEVPPNPGGTPMFVQAVAVATTGDRAYIRPENNLYRRR